MDGEVEGGRGRETKLESGSERALLPRLLSACRRCSRSAWVRAPIRRTGRVLALTTTGEADQGTPANTRMAAPRNHTVVSS